MKPLRILLGSFLIAVLLVVTLALPVWYVYAQGRRVVSESEAEARNRAMELTITLNTLSGESLYYNNLIALSHTMETIVSQSKTRNDAYEVEEIFLADRTGQLLAHSDVARVASGADTTFDVEKMHMKDFRFKGDPVGIDVSERVALDFGPRARELHVDGYLSMLVQSLLPDLAASRYHVFGSVYMPDEDMPAGTLHVLIHNQNAEALVAYFTTSLLQTLGIAVGGAAFLWLAFTILLVVLVYQPTPGSSRRPAGAPASPAMHDDTSDLINDDEFEPLKPASVAKVASLDEYRNRKKALDETEEGADARSRILDAVPLDHL